MQALLAAQLLSFWQEQPAPPGHELASLVASALLASLTAGLVGVLAPHWASRPSTAKQARRRIAAVKGALRGEELRIASDFMVIATT